MAAIPVVCDNCGKTWTSTNFIGGSGTIVSRGNKVGPCPYCGGMGSVPDGTYTFSDPVRTLRKASPEDLALIRSVLEQVKSGLIPEAQAVDALQEAVPGSGGLLGSKSQTLGTWIGVLLGIIAILIALRSGGGTTITNNLNVGELNITEGDAPPLDAEQVQQIVAEVLRQEEAGETATTLGLAPDPTVVAASNAPAVSAKVPRNSPCSCGSGKKYKRCHGAADDS